jgi:murein L,D-transpeptidase YcbB/YkuD
MNIREIDMSLYSEQRIDQLIDECTKTALQQIIGPFGLSAAMFNDRDGGAVDTIHNAKQGIMTDELKSDYENRGEYDSNAAHDGSCAYSKRKKELNDQKNEGTLKNAYSNTVFDADDATALDHVMAAKEIHDDRAGVLAELDTADLANIEENLQMTGFSLNSAMGEKSMEKFIQYIEETKDERRTRIAELEGKETLTEKESNELNKLQQQEDFDPEIARKLDKQARKAIEKAESKAYYKFIKKDKNGKRTSTLAHTGLYFNGETCECSSGVQHKSALDKKWEVWGIPACVTGDVPVPVPPDPDKKPTLRKGDSGPYVTLAQTELLQRGYDLGSYGADGKFGQKTFDAVKAFQRDWGLAEDGIIGEKTWAMLESTPARILYTVTVPHLSLKDAEALAELHPGSRIEKEAED